jgi:hypothetical protein
MNYISGRKSMSVMALLGDEYEEINNSSYGKINSLSCVMP